MVTELEHLHTLYIDDIGSVRLNENAKPYKRVHSTKCYEEIPIVEGIDISNKKVFVWSDLHFNHRNIIEYSDRPFNNTDDMNESLINNFNKYVQPTDVSIWVGDIAFGGTGFANDILNRCNGYKILVVGNHDFDRDGTLKKLKFDEVHLLYFLEESNLVFTHFPMYNLPKKYFNLHGHHHINGREKLNSQQHINVNCEFHNYKPVELNRLIAWTNFLAKYDQV